MEIFSVAGGEFHVHRAGDFLGDWEAGYRA